MTGGYGGIGKAVAAGWRISARRLRWPGHNAEKAKACAEAIGGYAAPFDALSVADTRRMVDDVAAHFGRLDILVNCVGLNQEAKAEEFNEETLGLRGRRESEERDVPGAGSGAPHDRAGRRQAGAHRLGAHASWVCAAGAMRPTARPRAGWRFCASNSRPSGRRTRSTSTSWRRPSCARTWWRTCSAIRTFYNALVARIPLGRIAEPEDVANAVLFFASRGVGLHHRPDACTWMAGSPPLNRTPMAEN